MLGLKYSKRSSPYFWTKKLQKKSSKQHTNKKIILTFIWIIVSHSKCVSISSFDLISAQLTVDYKITHNFCFRQFLEAPEHSPSSHLFNLLAVFSQSPRPSAALNKMRSSKLSVDLLIEKYIYLFPRVRSFINLPLLIDF